MHNVNAERMRAAGCSWDEFIEAMRKDDELDARLTEMGIAQALETRKLVGDGLDAELVVSSPHRRAIDTVHLVFPQHTSQSKKKVVVIESIREHYGLLLNGKRLSRSELQVLYPECDFSAVEDDEDALWTQELESDESCRERAYQTLQWIFTQEESKVVLAGHGGIFGKMMEHAKVEASEDMK